MKKIISAFIIFAVSCLMLCSCGSDVNPDAENTVKKDIASVKKIEKPEEKPKKEFAEVEVGDGIATEFAEMTIDESGIEADIKKEKKSGSATYISGPSPVEGSKYVYIRGTVKSLSKSVIDNVTVKGQAEIDGYTFELESIDLNETSGAFAYEISPLTSYEYTLYAKIPDELADSHEVCEVKFGFDELFSYEAASVDECKYAYVHNVA